ncbi:MAG: dynamin family protein [Anaerolineae bacterium]|nr:dynamin family protein [Anaerolineae bacterium]
MLRNILSRKQSDLVKEEKRWLERLQLVLAGFEVTPEDQATLSKSLHQLDELFLLVIVGEFNSGKSAFINALLGDRFLPEGVTPTTSQIHILRYGPDPGREVEEEGVLAVTYPTDFLQEINIVDTPGTNAIIRRHEQLTQNFVPRSDLVIFVTSVDRPFTESERAFMEQIRQWGKKVVIILNKIDLIEDQEVAHVVDYIRQNALALLGFAPEILPVSARLALRAKLAQNRAERDAQWAASRFQALETYILKTLDEKSRVQLKLQNPLGVGERLAGRYLDLAHGRLDLLARDVTAIDNIESQLDIYRQDMQRDFRYRLVEVENALLAMNSRGMTYFDETLRVARVLDLINTQRIRGEFERQVVVDTPQEIERDVQNLIDWLVEKDLRQWQATLEYLDRHRVRLQAEADARDLRGDDKIIGQVGGPFEYNRRALLDSVGRAAQEVVLSYDRQAEARQLAEGVRDAVAGTALVEVGAVGLGAVLVLVLHTALADFTGILAASTLAVVGLLIIPAKRRRAKADLQAKLETLREQLMEAMTEAFERELNRSVQRLREAIAPYTRFVRSEQQKLGSVEGELAQISGGLGQIRSRIEEL